MCVCVYDRSSPQTYFVKIYVCVTVCIFACIYGLVSSQTRVLVHLTRVLHAIRGRLATGASNIKWMRALSVWVLLLYKI